MTMCLGVNLGDAVVLAADGRRTMSSGERVDDVQKLVKIVDTLWSAGAGNLPLTAYIQGVLAERQPVNVVAYLKRVQTFAQKALAAHAELFDTLAGQPGHAGVTGSTLLSVLLVGGFDPDRNTMALYGFSSADQFEVRLYQQAAIIGGRPDDQQLANVLLGTAFAGGALTPESVAAACRLALHEVAKVNPDIGSTGHVVIVTRTGSELRSF